MLSHEELISLTTAVHRMVVLPQNVEVPQIAKFVAWSDAVVNVLCGGESNERLRQYLKSHAKEVWHLVNWLTHARSADRVATDIAIGGCGATLHTFIQLLERLKSGGEPKSALLVAHETSEPSLKPQFRQMVTIFSAAVGATRTTIRVSR